MVYGVCRALLRDPVEAEDATQSTFVSAYKALLGGGEVREPAAWLATIARNECRARAHQRMREPLPLLDVDVAHVQGPEAELDRRLVVEELQQAIAELPEKQREAVVLRDLYGLRYTEVGAALGMSVASVESLLFRARRSLRVSLKPLAGGALTVPLAVREGVAQALPGFAGAGASGGGAAGGAMGLGLLAKLTGGPVVAKVAAGVVAVTAAGSAAVVGIEHAPPGSHARPPAATPAVTQTAAPVVAPPGASPFTWRAPGAQGGSDRHGAGEHRNGGSADDGGSGASAAATATAARHGDGEGRAAGAGGEDRASSAGGETQKAASSGHESGGEHGGGTSRSGSGSGEGPGSGSDGSSGATSQEGDSVLSHPAGTDPSSEPSGSGGSGTTGEPAPGTSDGSKHSGDGGSEPSSDPLQPVEPPT